MPRFFIRIMRGIAAFLYTMFIYVGLPILGWGLDDLDGFFTTPQFFSYTISIAVFGLLAGATIQRPGGMGTRGKGLEGKFFLRQRFVRFLVIGILFFALIFVPFADRRAIGVMPGSPVIRWSGMVLSILGMGLIFWSGSALGRLYSPEVTLQKEHNLVTDGPYRYIRHPRYLGGMVQGIGLALLFRSWIGLAFTFTFVVIVLFRIHDEEALMIKEFGETWEHYCSRTWRLMPFVF